ncbi:nucleoside 2-deoxyribosyltransferase [Limobrevibacterium gyesilva]|uniref:Nucleoside 2-deoxyribosyltransferase n=1 Tax=Limobrevibacterium gyesilva TaxID=2991712 RepID=A0AA41YQB2_9PROT|nr:nucleoside 2-deoxyribosyltransferase [Limobrevibacterium gyesilva]MCW3476632.1 nucleoside 2-deoxyribosyltransferase [Limobrevibacterium gyesilva]
MRVYLAGPDVFLPDAAGRAAALKAVCARHGLRGVSPLDCLEGEPSAWAGLGAARRIALCNEAHIRRAAAVIANLTPFRGPSADAGTVFEVGFMRALGRPVFGWSNTAALFTERTRAFVGGGRRGVDGAWRDDEGLLIEAFGLADNLMIDGAVLASGGALFAAEVPAAARWVDLSVFERCVAAASRMLLGAASRC